MTPFFGVASPAKKKTCMGEMVKVKHSWGIFSFIMTAAVTHTNTTCHAEPRDEILPLSCAFYTDANLCGSVNRFIP